MSPIELSPHKCKDRKMQNFQNLACNPNILSFGLEGGDGSQTHPPPPTPAHSHLCIRHWKDIMPGGGRMHNDLSQGESGRKELVMTDHTL